MMALFNWHQLKKVPSKSVCYLYSLLQECVIPVLIAAIVHGTCTHCYKSACYLYLLLQKCVLPVLVATKVRVTCTRCYKIACYLHSLLQKCVLPILGATKVRVTCTCCYKSAWYLYSLLQKCVVPILIVLGCPDQAAVPQDHLVGHHRLLVQPHLHTPQPPYSNRLIIPRWAKCFVFLESWTFCCPVLGSLHFARMYTATQCNRWPSLLHCIPQPRYSKAVAI